MINKWFDTISSINQACYSDNLIRFFKVHAYQGALEAMLSFYIVQIGLISICPLDWIKETNYYLLLFVVTSAVVSVIVFTFYLTIIILRFLHSINKNIKLLKKNTQSATYEDFVKVREEMKRASLSVHKIGVLSYTLVTIVMFSIFYIISRKFIFFILFVGILCGVVWNVQDYFADNRLNCYSIFKGFCKLKYDDKIKIHKTAFKYTAIHTFVSIGIFFSILIFVNIRVYKIIKVTEKAKFLFEGNIIRNAYILLFLAIIALYAKTVFSLYNKKKQNERQLYILITDLGCTKSDIVNECYECLDINQVAEVFGLSVSEVQDLLERNSVNKNINAP